MATLAEAKEQAVALAALLRQQASLLRSLDPPIPGLSAQAAAIEQSSDAIVAAANAAIDPPVIVLKRSTISPSDVPGATDQEKILNAHMEAVERGRPMRWDRRYLVTSIELAETYNGLEIVCDPDCGPVLNPDHVNPGGLMYYFAPRDGTSLEVTMRRMSMLGNRENTRPGTTQHALTLGNPGKGKVRLILEDSVMQGFRMSGIAVWGDGCEVLARNSKALDCGAEGFGTTRGRILAVSCEAARCGIGFNASAGEYNEYIGCFSHHNLGAGVKVSLRSGETDSSGAAFKARLHLAGMRIEDNGGTGLTSTSAAAGSVVSGSATFARNAGGAINLTDLTEGRFDDIVSVDDGAHVNDDAASILLTGAGRHRFRSLDIRGGLWRGLNGGWGRELSIGRLSIDGCAGPGLRWVNAPISYDEYVPGVNGGPDELANN